MNKIRKALKALGNLVRYRMRVLKFLEFSDDPNRAFSGSVQDNELPFIKEIVNKANSIQGPILEIGTLFGFTTQHIAVWKNESKKLITVDNFQWNPIGLHPSTHREFTARILLFLKQRSNLEIHEGLNTEFYDSYNGPTPSMIFIDAGHSYEDVMVDINWAKSMNIPLISGHDYNEFQTGVTRAVNEAFGQEHIKVEGSVWLYESR